MREADIPFKEEVYKIVAQIPSGRVMTYGQIAALCGKPRAARIIGGIAHWGPIELPWQRVVKRDGALAEGYPGGIEGHKANLEAEGVRIADHRVQDMERLLWWPQE